MPGPKPVASINYAISQVFSPALFKKMENPAYKAELHDLLITSELTTKKRNFDIIDSLEIMYTYLKQNYRCEYVYKNEIANQLLLNFHGDNSATLLREVTSQSCIADIVIVNGKTTAYEIKTELDGLDRLANQTNAYCKIYDYVYVVTHPDAVKVVKSKVNKHIGVIVLDNEGCLKTIKKATKNTQQFEPTSAAFTLRQSELVKAYEKLVGKLPPMGTALIHQFCYHWYLTLDNKTAYRLFFNALKSRKPSSLQFELVKASPASLKMIFLSRELPMKYCLNIKNTLGIFG